MQTTKFKKVTDSILFVSEPNPYDFGNKQNDPNPNWSNPNWLKSRFHFSFAEYSNPKNIHFGPLRVMNDDLVQPLRGFGTHPHSNAEIVTYVVEGELTHKDSMGTRETLSRGAIQFMTAGYGIQHSEHNAHESKPLRFIQMWFTPRQMNLKPNYGSINGNETQMTNQWAHLVSDVQNSLVQTPVKINQDINIFIVVLDEKGKNVDFTIDNDRQGYMLCMEGEVTVTGAHGSEEMKRHDGAEVKGKNELLITALEDKTHVMIVEMAKTKDSRFD